MASTACTRAGAFAILLSLTLFTLIPYWQKFEQNTALNRYFALRYQLVGNLDALNDDYLWQYAKSNNSSIDTLSIAELLETSFELPSKQISVTTVNPPVLEQSSEGNEEELKRPSPPTGLKAYIENDWLPYIAETLEMLNDAELLENVSKVSSAYDYSIQRWKIKVASLIQKNRYLEFVSDEGVLTDSTNSKPETEEKNELLRLLTLQDIQNLSLFDFVATSANSNLEELADLYNVDVKPGAIPKNLKSACIFLQVILLACLIYFKAFIEEAVDSPKFPANGTLFSAFGRSKFSRISFMICLWCPVIVSVWLAYESWQVEILGLSIFIGVVVFLTNRVLSRKNFFQGIWD